MTDRERLLEILNKPIFPHEQVDPLEAVADYLLDNGVTFAKDTNVPSWIPVTERLPESGLPKGSKVKQIKVLTALISDKGVRTVRSQMRYKDTWATGYQEIWRWKYSGSEITHWMPLPEPPKEEGHE